MSRAAQIDSIIQKRHPLAERIGLVEANLRSLATNLRDLEEHRNAIIAKVDDAVVIGYLREIDFPKLHACIEAELQALSKLRMRFSRDTINIGVVGRARQGKSRLLQSLTGLTTAEIPDGDRQHCTGVRSTIHHNAEVEAYGKVWFHSERSFLEEVIAPYYEKLRLGPRPANLDLFATQPLPPLPSDLAAYAEPGAMHNHLKRYYENVDKYRHLLRSSTPEKITTDRIREYVAQDTPDGQRIFFNYLAVREVEITCKFPNDEVGKIALVDMPGLGDTGIGDEERLVKTLGQDVDIVLFVRMPKSSGDYWADVDVRLYDIACDALTDLPIHLWSFLVLNRTTTGSKNGDNWNNCQDLASSLAEKRIRVIEHMVANCSDRKEANAVLDLLLSHLTSNITSLDRQYASACQERLHQLQAMVSTELEKALHALNYAHQKGNWFPLFEQLFDEFWDSLATGLEELLEELREQRNLPDMDFKQQVDAALRACKEDTGIPSKDQIEIRRNRLGGYPNAYYEYLNEIRAHLSQHFLLIDKALKRGLERVKSQVADVLIKRGHLHNLVPEQGTKFLECMVDQLPEELVPGQPSKLKLGFHILASFGLSYRGLIQHRIRQHLDDLTPNETQLQLSLSPNAQEVLNCLNTLHAEAIYKCRTALDDLLAEPSQAAFAIVEEFVDRILRAEGVKTEWRIFLEEVRSEVWLDQFQQLGERTRTRREWLDSVEQAMESNQQKLMRFLD